MATRLIRPTVVDCLRRSAPYGPPLHAQSASGEHASDHRSGQRAWLHLVDVKSAGWRDRAQFFALSAQVMRRILVDAARARGAHKRGSGAIKVNVDDALVLSPERDESIVTLHETLEGFAKIAPRQAKVVELRYFGGLSVEEISEVMKISPRTIERDWDFSKIWLKRELSQ